MNTAKNQSQLLLVEEIAQILRISRTKSYQLINDAPFPVIRIGRSVRIPSQTFWTWMTNQLGGC